jgi:hypothetical protein
MQLKSYHLLLFMLFMAFCLFASASYAWFGYAAFTERPGMNGHLYLYYDLTAAQFCFYNFFNAAIALGFVFLLVKNFSSENITRLVKVFWFVAIFSSYVIIAELYLQTRFIAKG